jgi:hypothetical protein
MKGFAIAIRQGSRGLRLPAIGILLLPPVLGAFTSNASATVLNGSLRTSLYLQESRLGANEYETRFVRDDTGAIVDTLPRQPLANRARLVEEVRLDATRLGVKPLGFHTSFSAGSAFVDRTLQETRYRLFRAFLEWNGARRGPGLGYDFRLGRHWVLAGVGSRTIDGLSAKVSDSRFGDLTVFGGTLGTDRMLRTTRFWTLDKTDVSRTYGGRLRLARTFGSVDPQLALSFSQVERSPSGTLVTDAQRVGVHAEVRPSRTFGVTALHGARAWGDMVRDMTWGHSVSLVGGLDYSHRWRDLRCRVEYGQRRADLPATSRLAVFAQDPRKELRGGVGATVTGKVRLDLEGDYIAFAEPQWNAGLSAADRTDYVGNNKEKGLTVTASGYGLSLGYRFHRGAGGDLDGLVFYGHRELMERFTVDASIGFSDYNFERISASQEFDDSRQESSGILALGYRLLPELTLTGQVEGMKNEGMNRDLRFLGIVNWRFRTAF